MDKTERKRAKEREKKRKQREKLKQNQDEYAEIKRKDAERKIAERGTFKENVEKHPQKYESILEKRRAQNTARVKRFREKQRAMKDKESKTQTPPKTASTSCKRVKEKEN